MSERPRVAITMGDAAGIGPEIIVKSLADPLATKVCVPVVLGDGRVLERAMEDNFRRATTLSEGSLSIFLTRPISAAILALCVLSLFSPYLQAWVLSRRNARAEGAAPARG